MTELDAAQTAARLRHTREAVLKLWEERVCQELSAAREQDEPTLRDELPAFLDNLAEAVAPGQDRGEIKENDRIGREHGRQRAETHDYSLAQVLYEYQLLRKTLFEVLQAEGDVETKPRQLLHELIDAAMVKAASEFTSTILQQSEHTTAELRATVEKLKLEQDLREQFVFTLTHDLRTPLTAARMSAQFNQRNPGDPSRVIANATKVLFHIDRADRMIRDLLDVNQVRAGHKLPLSIHALKLTELIRGILDELTTVHGDRFVLRDGHEIEIQADGEGVRRMLENLCSNAIKYGTRDEPIVVTLGDYEESVAISVHNGGIPIPPEEQSKLFEWFHRTPSAMASDRRGWGIGLTLVKGVAEAHGGTVTVKSTPAEGTTFTVTLPKT